MSKKVGALLLILVLVSLFFNIVSFTNITSISFDKDSIESNYNNILTELQSLREEVNRLTKENERLLSNTDYVQQISNTNNDLIREQIKLIELKKDWRFLRENEIFPIYDANLYSYDREIILYISFPKTLKLREKLIEVGSKLSQYCFNGLPIELQEIKDVEGKKIAVVNLRESIVNEGKKDYAEYVGYTWNGNYFQGSTGGILTYTKLVETFLQKDYKGEWIDGVQFLYQGAEVDFEHVPDLKNIVYR